MFPSNRGDSNDEISFLWKNYINEKQDIKKNIYIQNNNTLSIYYKSKILSFYNKII